MQLLFEGERCPDGVELFDYGVPKPGKTGAAKTIAAAGKDGQWFRYRTVRREPMRIELTNLEDALSIRYVNARSDEARADFLSRFGMIADDPMTSFRIQEIDRDYLMESQRSVRKLLVKATDTDHGTAVTALNNALHQHRSFALRATLRLNGPGGLPAMVLQPQTLFGLMLMEMTMAAENDVRLAECQHCRAAFLTGSLTGRRAHAVYCSDRCRVAALRARAK